MYSNCQCGGECGGTGAGLTAELFMVSIKVLSTSKQRFAPKPGACSLLSLPNQRRMRGVDFAGIAFSIHVQRVLGQSTLQVRQELMYHSWTLHLQVTRQWNYAKKIWRMTK